MEGFDVVIGEWLFGCFRVEDFIGEVNEGVDFLFGYLFFIMRFLSFGICEEMIPSLGA